MSKIIIIAQAVLQVFCQIFTEFYVLKLYAWYHEPSSSGSPDILLTRLLYYTKCQSHPAGDVTRVSVMPRKVTV